MFTWHVFQIHCTGGLIGMKPDGNAIFKSRRKNIRTLQKKTEITKEKNENGNQGHLVGKIILANFLEYRIEKFERFIRGVEDHSLYKRLSREGIIMRKPLPDAKILREKVLVLPQARIIAKIKKEGGNYSIHYTKQAFSIEYIIDNEKLQGSIDKEKIKEEKEKCSSLLNKLRRINTRNIMIHEILEGIVEYQRDYFESNNDNGLDVKLKSLQMKELAKIISGKKKSNTRDFVIDASRISRVIKGTSIITPREKVLFLRDFFSTKRDKVRRIIKVLLKREMVEIYNNQRKLPYTDEELRYILNYEYGVSITRREVSYCRKDLGILPSSERNGYVYRSLLANFSMIYPFTIPAVKKNVPDSAGVYELSLDENSIKYPNNCSQIFYIGSGKNLKKRLLSHLSLNGKNGGIKRFVKNRRCLFRYLQVSKGWSLEEKNLYNLFVTIYGDSPVCNHISPKGERSVI